MNKLGCMQSFRHFHNSVWSLNSPPQFETVFFYCITSHSDSIFSGLSRSKSFSTASIMAFQSQVRQAQH